MIYGYTRESLDTDRSSEVQADAIKNYLIRSQGEVAQFFNDDEPYGALPFLELSLIHI